MSIPIPVAMDYTSTVSGTVLKVVPCEQCRAEYVYRMERTAVGSGTSVLFLDNDGARDRASSRAEAELRWKLEQGVDLVPCPGCGWYQANMVPRARREHRRWMLNAGACLTIGLIPVGIIGGLINAGRFNDPKVPWPVFVGGLAVLAAVGVGLMMAKLVGARHYDPNSQDVEARKEIGQARAILRAELERMIRAQQEGTAAQGGTAPPDPVRAVPEV